MSPGTDTLGDRMHSDAPPCRVVPTADLIPEGVPVVVMPEGGHIPLRDHVVGWRVMGFGAGGGITYLGLRNVRYWMPDWWYFDEDGRRVQGCSIPAQVVGLVPYPWEDPA